MIKHDNIIYARDIHAIGGVETYVYELVKKYHKYDIAVVTKKIDHKQKERLEEYCRVYVHKDEPIDCKVIVTNWDTSILDYVCKDAKCYTGIHTDYSNKDEYRGIPKDNPRTTYICITQDSKKKFEKVTGIERTILCRNPMELENDKPLLLMSATRLTDIKDGGRTIAIANELDRQGINYLWFIFTTNEYEKNKIWQNPNVVHLQNRLDANKFFEKADWVVQPSICEGDSYTYREALYRGIPLVVCELGYFKEIGIKDNENALFLKEDLSNIKDVVKRMQKPLKFNFEPIKDTYDKIFAKGKSRYVQEKKKMYLVEALDTYRKQNIIDKELGYIPKQGERFKVNQIRLDFLLSKNRVKVIDEI